MKNGKSGHVVIFAVRRLSLTVIQNISDVAKGRPWLIKNSAFPTVNSAYLVNIMIIDTLTCIG